MSGEDSNEIRIILQLAQDFYDKPDDFINAIERPLSVFALASAPHN
jgi:hypothetical protein